MSFKTTVIWNSVSQLGQSGIQFLSTIILARLLSPDDFGIIGMVTIFITIGSMMVDSEMGGALLRKTHVTKVDYSTLFYYNLIISIILYLLLFFLAPLISNFYNKPILIEVIRVIGIVIIIHAFRVVQQVMIFRDLNFRVFAVISILSGLLSLSTAIILAYKGWGYWALIWQTIVSATLNVIFLSLYNRFIPILSFSKASFKEQFKFGISLLTSDTMKILANNISLNIIAKFAPLNFTGNYTQYMRITSFSQNFLSSLMNQSIFPTLAKIKDQSLLYKYHNNLYLVTLSITFTLTIIILLFSYPIIEIILGSQWTTEISIFQILTLTILPIALQVLSRNTLKAQGNTKLVLRIETIKSILIISLLIVSVLGGLKLIVWSVPLGQTIATTYCIFTTAKYLNSNVSLALLIYILASIILYILVLAILL